MSNNDEKNINIILNNNEEPDEVVISFSEILLALKKYLLPWIIVSVIVASTLVGITAAKVNKNKPVIEALISFNFSGISEGKTPDGKTFNITDVKKPAIIEAAFNEMNIPLNNLENVRQGIHFEGIRPESVIDKMTAYDVIFRGQSSSALSAADKMLSIDYTHNKYKVTFDYSHTSFSSGEAVEILNNILNCYNDYFFKTYKYNEPIGNAAAAIDFSTYDYAAVIDLFDNTLTSLRKYVNTLNTSDSTNFRSTQTGYSFSDLSNNISSLERNDLDKLSSYITINRVTKDKDSLISYYSYKIKDLERQEVIYKDELDAVTEIINKYEKDDVLILGSNSDQLNTQFTQASAAYDKLLERKLTAQSDLSETTQKIVEFKQRINDLNTVNVGSTNKNEKVEADIEVLNVKINEMVELVNITADEYYENVSLANAFSILSPASAETSSPISNLINHALKPIIIVEALVFLIFFGISFVSSIISYKKKKNAEKDEADDEEASPVTE